MNQLTITIRSKFQAVHCWPECPYDEVGFLRNKHRHEFHVEVELEVSKSRQKEFFICKNTLNDFLKCYEGKDLGETSCEQLAVEIYGHMNSAFGDCIRVSVFEDGENGSTFYSVE